MRSHQLQLKPVIVLIKTKRQNKKRLCSSSELSGLLLVERTHRWEFVGFHLAVLTPYIPGSVGLEAVSGFTCYGWRLPILAKWNAYSKAVRVLATAEKGLEAGFGRTSPLVLQLPATSYIS